MRSKFPYRVLMRVIIVVLIFFLIIFFSLYYVVWKNDRYVSNLVSEISDNYDFSSDCKYVYEYGGYYIVLTDDLVYVFDLDYNVVMSDLCDNLYDNSYGYNLVYKTNMLLYEEVLVLDGVVTYNYYDAYSLELVNSVVLE